MELAENAEDVKDKQHVNYAMLATLVFKEMIVTAPVAKSKKKHRSNGKLEPTQVVEDQNPSVLSDITWYRSPYTDGKVNNAVNTVKKA